MINKKQFEKMTNEQKQETIDSEAYFRFSDYAWARAVQALGVGHLLVGSPKEQAFAEAQLELRDKDLHRRLVRVWEELLGYECMMNDADDALAFVKAIEAKEKVKARKKKAA